MESLENVEKNYCKSNMEMEEYRYYGVFKIDDEDSGFSENIKNNNFVKKQIGIFLRAIESISKDYYVFEFEDGTTKTHNKLDSPLEKHNLYDHVERVFAYELYHRWSCLLCGNKEGWVINGEVGKYLKWFYSKGSVDNGKQKYPDLVLHKGQTCHEQFSQMIVCEIKRKDNVASGIVDDLNKLSRFTCLEPDSTNKVEGRFFSPFQCGAYIIINVERTNQENNIEEKLTRSEKSDDNNLSLSDMIYNGISSKLSFLKFSIEANNSDTKSIICILSNWDSKGNHTMKYQSLYNILNRNKSKKSL